MKGKRSVVRCQRGHGSLLTAVPPTVATQASAGRCGQQPLRGGKRAYAWQHPRAAISALPALIVLFWTTGTGRMAANWKVPVRSNGGGCARRVGPGELLFWARVRAWVRQRSCRPAAQAVVMYLRPPRNDCPAQSPDAGLHPQPGERQQGTHDVVQRDTGGALLAIGQGDHAGLAAQPGSTVHACLRDRDQ
jgi:hypothetical protein